MTTSPHPGTTPNPELVGLLEEASRGLVYSSESDRPFHVFALPAQALPAELTARRFAALVGADDGDPVEEWTLDRFFLPHIECVEPVDRLAWERLPRYDALKRLLVSRLADVRVFRVGQVQIRCFAVGRDAAGNLIGLETVAIET
jgi:hypothetical protein